MAQFHEITEVFQATDKETKQPVTDQYGNTKWMFKVKDQGPEGWMSVNRKAGSELKVGDHVYGIVDTWPEGKAKFVRQNPPEGVDYPASNAKPSAPSAGNHPANGSVDQKLDYIISLLENQSPSKGTSQASQGDDAPVDMSDLDY